MKTNNKYVTFAIVNKVKPQAYFQKKLSLLYANKMPPFYLKVQSICWNAGFLTSRIFICTSNCVFLSVINDKFDKW